MSEEEGECGSGGCGLCLSAAAVIDRDSELKKKTLKGDVEQLLRQEKYAWRVGVKRSQDDEVGVSTGQRGGCGGMVQMEDQDMRKAWAVERSTHTLSIQYNSRSAALGGMSQLDGLDLTPPFIDHLVNTTCASQKFQNE